MEMKKPELKKLELKLSTMIPSNGWVAVYEDEKTSTAMPLVSWGLGVWRYWVNDKCDCFENGVFGLVVNDDGDVVPAKTLPGFKTYQYDLENANIDFATLAPQG